MLMHAFRHSFAAQLLLNGVDTRTVHALLGDNDVKATQIYTRVISQHTTGVLSPIDKIVIRKYRAKNLKLMFVVRIKSALII